MYLDDIGEVFASHVVAALHEYLPQSALSHWVVLGIELVKPVERVPVLRTNTTRIIVQ